MARDALEIRLRWTIEMGITLKIKAYCEGWREARIKGKTARNDF
jgi:hypothetical protein